MLPVESDDLSFNFVLCLSNADEDDEADSKETKTPSGPSTETGLLNPDNYCFLNAAMQAIRLTLLGERLATVRCVCVVGGVCVVASVQVW